MFEPALTLNLRLQLFLCSLNEWQKPSCHCVHEGFFFCLFVWFCTIELSANVSALINVNDAANNYPFCHSVVGFMVSSIYPDITRVMEVSGAFITAHYCVRTPWETLGHIAAALYQHLQVINSRPKYYKLCFAALT